MRGKIRMACFYFLKVLFIVGGGVLSKEAHGFPLTGMIKSS